MTVLRDLPPYWWIAKSLRRQLKVGDVYGALTIVARAPSVGTGARYRVRCEAGHERVTRAVELRAGKTGCRECDALTPEAAE